MLNGSAVEIFIIYILLYLNVTSILTLDNYFIFIFT